MPNIDFFARLGLFVEQDFLDSQTCQRIRLEAESVERVHAMTYKADRLVGILDENVRKSMHVMVSKQTRSLIESRLLDIMPAVARHFDLRLSGCQTPDFLVYKKGDYFRLHRDVNETQEAHTTYKERKVSVVIFLNDQAQEAGPDSFSGGSLVLYGLIKKLGWEQYGFSLEPRAGSLIAFPSNTSHQVNTVTSGQRYTSVTWFI